MKQFLSYTLDPMCIMGFFLLFSLFFIFKKKLGIRPFIFVFLIAFFYGLCATPLGANFLLKQLEINEQTCNPSNTTTLVVLGGGIEGKAQKPEEIERLKLPTVRRVMAASDFISLTPKDYKPAIILSGGGETHIIKEAHIMAILFSKLTDKTTPVIIDDLSDNTYKSAVNVLKLIENKAPQKVCILTSAWHMKRALAVFKKQGIDVMPYAVDSRYLEVSFWAIIPQFTPIEKSMLVIHEGLGLLIYKLQGYL